MTTARLKLRAGDLIEVKSSTEIFATLDSTACLDGMPFMPEMLRFCGQQMRVAKVAHKTCDTKCKSGGRSIADCVHLEDSRCSGADHGRCQAFCNLFWKTDWLRKPGAPERASAAPAVPRLDAAALARTTRIETPQGPRYRCQATQILEASRPLAWWEPWQYWRDVTSGNVSLLHAARILVLSWFAAWRRYGYPYRLSRWAYAWAHRLLIGGEPPFAPHGFPFPAKSPTGDIGLKVGERVRVKPHHEILATLNSGSRNRGLWFDAEMVPFCGGEHRITHRVGRIINERTGEMMPMKGSCLILDGVVCRSAYSARRLFCPRAIPPYWREIWLERIEEADRAARAEQSDTMAK